MIDLIKKREKQAAYFESNTITQGEYIEIIDRAIAAEEELENMREERKELASSKEEWHRKWMYSDSKRERAEAKLAEIERKEPVFYCRPRMDDGYEGPIHAKSIERVRIDSGVWKPLYASPVQQSHQSQELTDITSRRWSKEAEFFGSGVQQSPAVAVQEWKPIETAPKDKAILLDIGFPWPVFGIFNTLNDEFAYADMQAENFENATDIYFQTDYEKNPVAWMPLPETVKSPSAKAAINE